MTFLNRYYNYIKLSSSSSSSISFSNFLISFLYYLITLCPQNSHYTHVALQPRRCEPGYMYSFHRLLYRGNQMYTRCRNIDGRRAQGGHLIQTVQRGEKYKPSRNYST